MLEVNVAWGFEPASREPASSRSILIYLVSLSKQLGLTRKILSMFFSKKAMREKKRFVKPRI